MQTTFNQEQTAFQDSLRKYLTDKCDQSYIRKHWDEASPCSDELWKNLVDMGVAALLVPESSGGLGMTMVDMGVVMLELGRRVNPAPVIASCVASSSIAELYNQKELLAQLASGDRLGAFAFEEEGQHFLNWVEPAVVANNGLLTGKKVRVFDALAADFLFVTANDGVYLVEEDAKGLTMEAEEMLDGSRRLATVAFEETPAKRLGDVSQLGPVIDRMAVALCADAVGAAEMALFLSLAYAKEREQFGVPVGSFQAVQHMLAEMFQYVEMAKAGLHYALWALADAEPEEAHRATALIKAYVADKFPRLGAEAIQIFGGAGFTWEYDIQLFYKRLLSAQLLLGGEDVWLEALARIAIDQD